eukprot:1883987-Prymnesium_polylepis.1
MSVNKHVPTPGGPLPNPYHLAFSCGFSATSSSRKRPRGYPVGCLQYAKYAKYFRRTLKGPNANPTRHRSNDMGPADVCAHAERADRRMGQRGPGDR